MPTMNISLPDPMKEFVEGMNSGAGKPITPELLNELKKNVSARVGAHKKSHSKK